MRRRPRSSSRSVQTDSQRVRSTAPALKNILSQLGGLAADAPWHKRRATLGAARRPKLLRMEGLERRELLTGTPDVGINYQEGAIAWIGGPAFYAVAVTPGTPVTLGLFGLTNPPPTTNSTLADYFGDPTFELHFTVQTDLQSGVDYRLWVNDTGVHREVTGGMGSVEVTRGAKFDIELLKPLPAGAHEFTVRLLDSGDYDILGGDDYHAVQEFNVPPSETRYVKSAVTAYLTPLSPTAVVSVVDCDCGCPCEGEVKADVDKVSGDAETTVVVSDQVDLLSADGGSPASGYRSTMDNNSGKNPHPILRGFDRLETLTGGAGGALPESIEVTTSYYQETSSGDVLISGTTTDPVFFAPDDPNVDYSPLGGIQYAIPSKPGTLTTGVYKWKMNVTYHYAGDIDVPRSSPIVGRQLIVNDADSPFGNRWTFSEFPQIVANDDKSKVVLRAGQSAYYFESQPNSGGQYYTPPEMGLSVPLTFSSNVFSYTDKYGTAYSFTAGGRPTKEVDRNGNVTKYVYSNSNPDASGAHLDAIVRPDGRRTIFTWDSNGKVSSIKEGVKSDGTGGTITTLDIQNGLLMSITRADADTNDDLPAPKTEFAYDSTTKRLTQVKRHIVSPNSPTETTYEITDYVYDNNTGTVKQILRSTGTGSGSGAAIMDLQASDRWATADPSIVVNGHAQGTAQNPAPLQIVGQAKGSYREEVESGVWRETEFTSDGFRQIASITTYPGTDEEATTRYERNSQGLVWRMTGADPDGPSGSQTSPVTVYGYDDDLNLQSLTLPNGDVRTWDYGAFNQVVASVDELGRQTLYELDTNGNVKTMLQVIGSPGTFSTPGDDVATRYEFTPALPTNTDPGTRLPGGLIAQITDPLNHVTQYKYFRANSSETGAGTGTTDTDRLGLVEKIIYAVSTTDQADVEFAYDVQRRLTSQKDELDRTTSYAYDALGQVVSITQPDAYAGDGLNGPVTTFQYDTVGRLALQTDPDPDGNDNRVAHWTKYTYSSNDRILTVTEAPREVNGAPIVTVYEHDRLNRVKKITDALGNETLYTYDDHDQVATVVLPVADSGAPAPVYTYDYDLLGRRKQVTQPGPGARTAPTAHSNPSVAATDVTLESSVVLYDPASPSSAVFTDTVDADNALRYEIVSNSNAGLFKSIRFATDGNGGRKLVLEYADYIASSATITLKVTNSAGLSSSTATVSVSRTAVTDTEQTVNTTTAGDQKNSSIAALSDGTYVIVWEGQGPTSTDDHGIWFQRFDKDGSKLGSQTQVNIATTGVQGLPAVAASADGTFAVVWYDYANSTAARAVFRTFNNDGTAKMSSEQQYWSNLLTPIGAPAVGALTGDNQGKYVMLWGTQSVYGYGDDIYAQVVSSTGTFVGNAFRINPAAPGLQQRPSIAAKADGGFVVVWDGDGSYGSTSSVQHSIFLRSFDKNFYSPWSETRVDLSDNYSSYAATSDGGFVVVWQDQETETGNGVIRGRRFGADGTPISSELTIANLGTAPFDRPAVAGTPDGGFVVGWHWYFTQNLISAFRYDRYGNSSAVSVLSSTATTPISPVDLAVGKQGGLFTTWTVTSSGATDVKANLTPLEPVLVDAHPKEVVSVEPGQAIFGAVSKVLVTFNQAITGSLTMSAVSLVDPNGTTISTGFSASRVSDTQFLISIPSQTAQGEYRFKLDTGLVSGGLASASITTFRILPPATPAGGTTLYAYDSLNRVTQTTDTAGAVTKFDYTVQSSNKHLLITESRYSPDNLTTAYSTKTYDYDQLARLVLVTLPAVAGLSASTLAYAYDKNGNVLRTTDQRGAQTDYRYDNRGRLVRRYDPRSTDGVATNDTLMSLPALSSESPLGPETQYTYTAASELEEVIGPAVVGSSGTITPHTKSEYDGLGRVKKVIAADPTAGTLSSTIYTSYVYDQIGNLISLTEPASGVTPLDTVRTPTGALTTTYSYDTQSNLTKVTLPAAIVGGTQPHIDYAYDDLGHRTQMIDELGRYTNYKYDGRSNLTAVIEANPVNINDHSLTSTARPTYQYQYDVLDNLLIETDPLGRHAQYSYDAASRLSHQFDALGAVQSYGYDAFSRQTSQTDALGRVTDFEFDQRDQLRKVTEANPLLPGQTGYSSTGQPEHSYAYDAAGNMVSYTDPLTHVTDYTFDYLGQLTDVYQPTVNSSRPHTQYAYDAAGNQTSVTDPMGRIARFTHDALSRLATRRDPDPNNTAGTSGLLTTYGYDNLSRLVSISMPDPANSSQTILTNYDYDAAGRVLRETQPEVPESYTNLTYVGTAHRTALNYSYDLAGQLVSSKDQMNLETTYAYDNLGRQTTKTVISPRATNDPDHDIVTTFGYDAVSNQTKVTDPVGAVTFTGYDALNRVTSVLDAREGITRFGYDAVGNQSTIVDAVGNVNSWAYDRLNRLASDTDPLGHSRLYSYDKAANLTSQIDRNGHKREFAYDELDRRTAEKWIADGTSTVTRTLSWAYSAAGDLTGTNDLVGTAIASAKYDYHYDAAGRLDKSLSTLAGLGTSNAVLQTHTLDAVGRRTGLANTIGGTFNTSTFTVTGGTPDFSNTYVYDKQSRLRQVTQSSPGSDPVAGFKKVDLMYNDRGQISTVLRQAPVPSAPTTTHQIVDSYYAYDGLGRQRRQLDWVYNSWGPAYDWWYDDANRMIQEAQTFESNTLYFKYDATGQLTQTDSYVDSVLADSNYVHDLAGNRQNVGDGIGAGNQLLEDADYEYTYDYEGNRTRRERTSSDTSLDFLTVYEYDFRQRLTKVTIYHTDASHKTAEVEYAYDTLDRRVSRTETPYTINGSGQAVAGTPKTEYYVYDEGSTRATSDGAHGSGDVLFDFYDTDGSGGSSSPTLRRRYLTAIDHVFAQENLFVDSSVSNSSNPSGAPAGTYWLIQDRLGTVRTVIGNDQVVWNHAQYDAFGNRVGLRYPHGTPYALDSSLTRYGFTGQEYDELTDLTWYSNGDGRGNWYDPKTNTWITRDALPVRGRNPNAYEYAANSPTNFTDPNGQDWLDDYFDVSGVSPLSGIEQAYDALTDYVVYPIAKWLKGSDEALASASANELLAGTALASTAIVLTGYFLLPCAIGAAQTAVVYGTVYLPQAVAVAQHPITWGAVNSAVYVGVTVYNGDKVEPTLVASSFVNGFAANPNAAQVVTGAAAKVVSPPQPRATTQPSVHLDIGGEGRYPNAVNVNRARPDQLPHAVPNMVRAHGERLPFRDRCADTITLENAQIKPGTGSEIARVIKPGGTIRLVGPADVAKTAHADIARAVGGTVTQTTTGSGDQAITTTTIIAPGH